MAQKITRVSLIITVLQEETSIASLLKSIAAQTHLPDEVIIVDGGSTDRTLPLLKKTSQSYSQINWQVVQKKGNRSVGRNTAIRLATHDWIAITDAGCILDPNWLTELLAEQRRSSAKVIAGYYSAEPNTHLEEAIVPYVFVMPDQLNVRDFLPATRSMLLHRSVWKQLGGFNENLSDNEDYEFARRIADSHIPKSFTPRAIVIWKPVQSLWQFTRMIFRFARGDCFALIIRPKVVVLFARYILVLLLLIFLWHIQSPSVAVQAALGLLGIYLLWAIGKNHRYVPNGWYWLPLLQLVADLAVMVGSVVGSVMQQRSANKPKRNERKTAHYTGKH